MCVENEDRDVNLYEHNNISSMYDLGVPETRSCFYNFAVTKNVTVAGYANEDSSDFIMSL